ncbi:hypothetical protein HNV08_07870 [Winogradskyella eckloniae]|uniref:hypothetical protein n=1 Tax=Winogradskyella eckloniae TaxID=1089306 RepID=UPI0015653AF5|nr:hypothetical protein [Winogradskyella eckloniae]NRD19961.1 hypothetical protein [Winogradskyella eckloniae]
MKKIVFCVFLFTVTIGFSQQTTLNVTESEEFKDKVKAVNVLAIHTNNALTGVIRESKNDYLYDVFDKDLNKLHSAIIESDRKEVYVGEVVFGNEIKVFTVYSPKAKERIVYCHIFNIESGSHTKKQLFDVTVAKKRSLFFNRNDRQTSFALSPNGNYLAIATDNIYKDVNDYAIRVFDANSLELLYTKSYQKHKEKHFKHNDISVSDNADIFILGKLYKEGKREKKKGEANYDFILNKVNENSNEELMISLVDQHINSLNISTIKDQLHLIGFYSEQRAGRIKGGCNFIIDSEKFAVSSKKNYELPIDVYEDLYGDKRGTKKEGKELGSFYIDYILEDSSGNTYLLAEEFYITQTYVSNGMNGGYWQTTYHYDDILILKFGASGQLDWGRSIFKRATAPSYNVFLKNDQLHVLLNSGKNLSEKKDGRTKVSQGWFESTSLYDITYNAEGEVIYSKIQDNKGKTFYLPFYGTFNDDVFIMMSDGRKKRQFMVLE